MWRVLALLLALCAPAQAALHADGFEKRMPVSDWIQLVGPKDGTLKQTISVPLSGGAAGGTIASGTAPMSSGDFPTTPFVITGVEFRIAALASHPGIAVHNVFTSSQWMQSTGSAQFTEAYGDFAIPETAFEVGDSGDLPDADYLAFGGYNAIVNAVELQKPSPVPALSSFPLTQPSWWTSRITITALGEPGSPYERVEDSFAIELASLESYTAELYVDAIEYRLHYEDASTTDMAGSGTVSATLGKGKSISTAMAGTGVAAGVMLSKRVIASTMAGAGKVTPVMTRDDGGTIYRYLMPELTGGGTMAVTPLIRYAPVPAAMSGGGTMSATLQRGHGIKASAPVAMSVTGTLAQSMAAQRPIARALSGVGTVVASVIARRPIVAALSGSGVQTIAMLAHRPVIAAMRGVGSLAVTIQRILGSQPVAASMEGSGSMAVDLIAHRPVAAAMTGAGAVNADGLTINTRLVAPEGRSFYAADDAMAFIAPDDFLTFEAQE